MTNREYVELFFERTQEKFYNELILEDKEYNLPKDKIYSYIKNIIDIPYIEFIDYMNSREPDEITKDNLMEDTSFTAYTDDMCKGMLLHGNSGYKYIEIGQFLSKHLVRDTNDAMRMFGAKQVKTASQLGLTFEYYGSWFLSCIGYVYNDLSVSEKRSFLARTILRDPLYGTLLQNILKQDVHMVDYMKGIPETIIGRRKSSVLKLFQLCLWECRKNGLRYHDLYYPRYTQEGIVEELLIGTYKALPIIYATPKKGYLPLYSLEAACECFTKGESPTQEGWVDIKGRRIKADPETSFVVFAKGNSMSPKIEDGDLCIFEWMKSTPDDGSIVLVQCPSFDSDYDGNYTIKTFYSERNAAEEGGSSLSKVELRPINANEYEPIVLCDNGEADIKVIGVLKAVISVNALLKEKSSSAIKKRSAATKEDSIAGVRSESSEASDPVEAGIDLEKLWMSLKGRVDTGKFFYFFAILTLIKDGQQRFITNNALLQRMCSLAWPYAVYDRVWFNKELCRTILSLNMRIAAPRFASYFDVEAYLQNKVPRGNSLVARRMKFVLDKIPYRFLSPWISYRSESEVVEKSGMAQYGAPYALKEKGIEIHPQWFDYFKDHYEELYVHANELLKECVRNQTSWHIIDDIWCDWGS